MLHAILNRFREPSTWAGLSALAAVLGAFGINVPLALFTLGPQVVDVLTQLLAIFGIGAATAAVVLPDKAKPPAVDHEPPTV